MRALTTVFKARREIEAALKPGIGEGTGTRMVPSSAATSAEAEVILICSDWSREMANAVWISFVTWSPPTPRTPA